MASEEFADYHYEVKFTLKGYTRADDNGSIGRHVKRSLELVVHNYMEAMPKRREIIQIEVKDLMEEEQ